MLDSDVAMLYNYETKKVNQAVKRNIDNKIILIQNIKYKKCCIYVATHNNNKRQSKTQKTAN